MIPFLRLPSGRINGENGEGNFMIPSEDEENGGNQEEI